MLKKSICSLLTSLSMLAFATPGLADDFYVDKNDLDAKTFTYHSETGLFEVIANAHCKDKAGNDKIGGRICISSGDGTCVIDSPPGIPNKFKLAVGGRLITTITISSSPLYSPDGVACGTAKVWTGDTTETATLSPASRIVK